MYKWRKSANEGNQQMGGNRNSLPYAKITYCLRKLSAAK